MSKLQNPIFDLLRGDAHISVNKALIFAIGLNEAVIYSELLSRYAYFVERDTTTDEGYFYNTVDDLYSGTGLTDYQQRMAIAVLKNLGLIQVKVKGIPPKRFFRVVDDPQTIANLLKMGKENALAIRQNANSKETSELILKKLERNKINNNSGFIIDDSQFFQTIDNLQKNKRRKYPKGSQPYKTLSPLDCQGIDSENGRGKVVVE